MLAHASFVVRTVVKAFYSIFHRIGIEGWFTEHGIAEPASTQVRPQADVVDIVSGAINFKDAQEPASATAGIGLGDKVVLVFADDQKRLSVRVSEGGNDLEKGCLSASSPLRRAIFGLEEGDEVELSLENGRQRKVLIESVQKGAPLASMSVEAANGWASRGNCVRGP